MGLSNKGSSSKYVNCVSKPEPQFNLMETNGDGWVVHSSYNNFEGQLIGASTTTYEYKGEVKNKLVLEFDVDGDKYNISFNLNSVSKSLINTLSNQNCFGKILKLSLYKKGDFANIFITCDGERIGWKFGPEQVSKIFNQDDRWVDMFNKYVKPEAEKYQQTAEDPIDKIKIPTSPITTEDDDLPF